MLQVGEVLAALIIFIATYLFLAGAALPFLKLDRPGGARWRPGGHGRLGVLTPDQVYRDAISWDTLVLLLGYGDHQRDGRASIFRWIPWVAAAARPRPPALLAILVAGRWERSPRSW